MLDQQPFEGLPQMCMACALPCPSCLPCSGHNLEAAWLALDTLDYLHSINAINDELAASYRTAAISVGEAAVRDGYDHKHGGIFQDGSASGGPVNTDKVWWVQAEAMQALWKLHQHHEEISSGSSGMYLQMLADTVRFMKEHVTDTQGPGEQFWQVRAV